MTNFKVNEYFKDYIAIQKEYFSDLKVVSDPKKIGKRIETKVLLNGEEYNKIENISDEIDILFVPKNIMELPIIQFRSALEKNHLEIYKIVDGKILEHLIYLSVLKENDDAVIASLEIKSFDISKEINNNINYNRIKDMGNLSISKLIDKKNLFAKRNIKNTIYFASLSNIMTSNNSMSLFELLKDEEQKEKTKNK